ncbi:MAG: hypothetical protein ACOCS6_02505, partial [Desulfosalsimonas sp.]
YKTIYQIIYPKFPFSSSLYNMLYFHYNPVHKYEHLQDLCNPAENLTEPGYRIIIEKKRLEIRTSKAVCRTFTIPKPGTGHGKRAEAGQS